MKYIFLQLSLLLLTPVLQAQSPVGRWKTIDDVENKAKSIVEIFEQDGKLHGKIVEIFPDPGEDPDPVCEECPGDKKNQKVVGMEILWGLEKDGNEWNGGEVLDPENGKVYDCYIELVEPDKLKLRGFIGFSLLGRTQYWYREMGE